MDDDTIREQAERIMIQDILRSDPGRVSRVMSKLQTLWSANPELRLGQLIVCLVGDGVFGATDEALEKAIDDV